MKGCAIYTLLYLTLLEILASAVRIPLYTCTMLTIRNGKVKRRQRGRFVKFVCNPGYMLAGERFSSCLVNGTWDPSPPKCVRPTCNKKVNPPANGLIYPTHSGAGLHFYCKPGYMLRGPMNVYCDGRKWDDNMPVCLAANTKPKLFCDFEEESICDWSHDLNHDFDWRREKFATPSGSIGTGPSFDHTKGQGKDGHYMYIESSSRSENDTARLISPIFNKTDTETCFEFYYHMFGATTGSLRVYLKKFADDWSLEPSEAFFSKSGNQGNKWYRSYHSLGVINEDYQIVIEGVRGPGYVSDIAIDDVRVIEDCVFEDATTTTEGSTYSTETLLKVESCINRCGQKAKGNELFIQITCDCDDSCYDNNRCCPDYFDYCLSGTSSDEYLTTTDLSNEIIVATSKVPYGISYVPFTTTRKTFSTTRSVQEAQTTRIPTRTTTKSSPPVAKKVVPVVIHNEPVPETITKKSLPKIIPTKSIYKYVATDFAVTTRRPIILTPTLPPVIVKKVLPPTTLKPKKIIIVKPKKVGKEVKKIESNDVLDVLEPTKNDEELLLTSPLPVVVNKKKWSPENVEDHLDSPFWDNFSEKDKFLSSKAPESDGYNIVLICISCLVFTIVMVIIGVVLVRRYRFSHRRMASSSGDSQSDVRFLTSDEVLNFSLDKDYDSL